MCQCPTKSARIFRCSVTIDVKPKDIGTLTASHLLQLYGKTAVACEFLTCDSRFFCFIYASSKALLSRPQTGQTKSSGTSSQAVPGAMPQSGSPTAGSYSYPQGHTYFIMILLVFQYYLKYLLRRPSNAFP